MWPGLGVYITLRDGSLVLEPRLADLKVLKCLISILVESEAT